VIQSRIVFSALVLASSPALAATCPLPGQKPMLLAKMYFGQNRDAQAWENFLARTVTARFPAGLTVYEAQGQWTDPKTGRLTRERSRVVEIATPDTAAVRANIVEIARLYRRDFRQQSVGVVTQQVCAQL
jgi:hypothetical protein